MLASKNKPLSYKKLIKMRIPKKIYKRFYLNIVYFATFDFFYWIYEFFIKGIISIFAFVLIRSYNQNQKVKRRKVVNYVYDKFSSSEYNFIWLSTAFYMLISFVSVIYIVYFLNITINDNIGSFTNYVDSFYKETVENKDGNTSTFQALFNVTIFNKFIPGGDLYFNPSPGKMQVNSLLQKLYTLIPGSFVALPALYIAAGGYGKLIISYNVIYSHEKVGTYWGNKAKGLFIVLGVAIILWAMSTLNIFIQARLFNAHRLDGSGVNDLLYIIFTIIFFILIFLYLFKFVPSFKINFKGIYKGVIISALPSVILVIAYTYLSRLFTNNNYGAAVGFFFSIGFFVNWFVYFMFLGITFNNAYYKSYINTRTIPKKTLAWWF
ncbi:YhjD/YihY/BrkB family envelope integrity protein [Mycoplasma sp. 246B]